MSTANSHAPNTSRGATAIGANAERIEFDKRTEGVFAALDTRTEEILHFAGMLNAEREPYEVQVARSLSDAYTSHSSWCAYTCTQRMQMEFG